MTYAELTRKLRELGCVFKRQAKGSHEISDNPRVSRSTVAPNHSGDLPAGTIRAILRHLEISPDDLREP